ncbi:MAG: winged helix-turn-helix transcriptional regulator [Candidatus Bathyarchaeota archaeon]|nr:MAG: winged helix-turn-helix transcriptional regulator [Candidatus Bathyarchaeota archaeon]
MDEKDEMIIRVLERKARLSSRVLSKMVGLPISTVHRRIKKLEREGIIYGYKALINYERTNRPIGAFLLVNLEEVIPGRGHIPKKTIVGVLRRIREIEEITEVQAFNFELVIKARLHNLKALAALMEQLRSIEGIEHVSSAIITEETILPPSTLRNSTQK